MARSVIFIEASPAANLPPITLYADTWQDHILVNHPEMAHKLETVREIVRNPTLVCQSATESDRALFMSSAMTSRRGSPLVVAVDARDGTVCTAYYCRNFRRGPTIWSR